MEEEIICIVNDQDFNLDSKELINPVVRLASRGLVFNEKGEIAIFHKKNKNEYKLPGGGVEIGEDLENAFLREVLEETGCIVEIVEKLGITIEEKSLTNFKQISHVFVAIVKDDTKVLHLTKKEQDEGSIVIWTTPQEGHQLIENSIENIIGSKYDDRYQSLFMVKRDALILHHYLKRKTK